MLAIFKIVQGLMSTIMETAGLGTITKTVLPQEIITAVKDCGFFESIPLWAVTLIGGLFVTVLSIFLALSLIHISEPTRLGMISYAVFCLKKKNKSWKIGRSDINLYIGGCFFF